MATSSRHSPLACAAVIVVGLLATATATATPSDQDLKRVESLRQEAIVAAKARDWVTCEAKAAQAWSIAETPVTAGLLGNCEAETGHYVSAANHLDYALRLDESADRRKLNSEKLADVKTKVAVLSITMSPSDATLKVAGTVVTDPGNEIYVLPGRLIVECRSPGYETKSVEVDLGAGETKALTFTLERHVETPPTTHRPIWPAVLLGGVSIAGLGTGIALGAIGSVKHGDAMDKAGLVCDGGPRASGACGDLDSLISESNTLRNAGWGVGGVGLAAGVGMLTYLLWPQPAAAKPTVDAGRHGAVLIFQGAF